MNSSFSKLSRHYDNCVWVIKAYYWISILVISYEIRSFIWSGRFTEVQYLPWIQWLNPFPVYSISLCLILIWWFLGVSGSLLWRLQWYRIFFFISILVGDSFLNSFGKVNNGLTQWVWIAFALCLVPTIQNSNTKNLPSSRRRLKTIFSIVLAQALLLLPYTLSGLWKIKAIVNQIQTGEANAFSPDAMSRLVATISIQSGSPFLGDWIIAHNSLGHISYMFVLVSEVIALGFLFFPRFHVLAGMLFCSFHFATLIFLNIPFPAAVGLLGIFLIQSPFAPEFSFSWNRKFKN